MARRRLLRAALPALPLAFAACNAVFGITAGEPREASSGGAGAAGAGGRGAGGPGGAGGGVSSGACGDGSTGDLVWAAQSTGSEESQATGVALGTSDDAVVTGIYTRGGIRFGTTSIPHSGDLSTSDIFLASFELSTGKPRWGRGFPSEGDQRANDVAVDPISGDIVLTGKLEGSISFDGGMTGLTSEGGSDIFVARFTKDGDLLWSLAYGDSEAQAGSSVGVDGDGNVVFAAIVEGRVQFNGITYGVPGDYGILLAQLSALGTEGWSRFYPTSFLDDDVVGLDVNAAGHIVMTGSASTDNFDSSDNFKGDTDAFILRFDQDGTLVWSRLFGGATAEEPLNGRQWGTAAVIDAGGDVFVTGAFKQDLVFGDLPALSTVFAEDEGDIFLARLRGDDGEPIWARAFGDYGYQRGGSLGSDGMSNVVLGGTSIDSARSAGIDLGTGEALPPSPPDGDTYREDLLIAKYSPDGCPLWARRFGDEYIQQGEISVAPSGEVVAAGDFYFNLIFDATPKGRLSDPGRDMFVAKLAP